MEGSTPKQRINELWVKYKYPILVVLVGLGLMLLPSKTEPAPERPVQLQQEPGIFPTKTA